MSQTYDYNKTPVDVEKLRLEILADETIVKTLETIIYNADETPNKLHITFDLALSAGEETALDTLVTNHDGNPPTTYDYFCYCCGLNHSEAGLVTPTQCQCCSSTDIQVQYHKCNFIATVDPEADDDITEGYCMGSKWINISTGMVFQCVDATTDAAVWKCATREHDWIEEFNRTPNAFGGVTNGLAKSDSGTAWIYGSDFVIEHCGCTLSKVESTKLRLTSIATGLEEMIFSTLHAINPADHTYLETRWKFKYSSTNFNPQIHITDLNIGPKYMILTKVNATTINVYVTGDGDVTSEDYDIAYDLTSDSELCLKVKSGQMKFFIDDVLKATFTVANAIWYDVTDGVILYHEAGQTGAGALTLDLDYIKFLTGRSF